MAREIINVGAAPNDGTGDPIRTAYIKCNNNFGELYSRAQVNPPASLIGTIGDQAGMYAYDSNYFYYCFQNYNGSSVIWAQITQIGNAAVQSITNGTTSVAIPVPNGNVSITVGGTTNVGVWSTNRLTMTGDILPSGNGLYDLGSSSRQWRSLYVSNSSIWINDVQLTVQGNSLQVAGANVLTVSGANNISVGNITGTNLSVTNATVSNVLTVNNDISVTDDLSVGSDITAGGTVTAGFFVGDGSQLTNLPGGGGNGGPTTQIVNGFSKVTIPVSSGNIQVDVGLAAGIAKFYTQGLILNGGLDITGNINQVTSTGNVTAPYFIGDGSLLTNLPSGGGNASQISNGSSKVAIGSVNGNVVVDIGASANVLQVSSSGIGVTGGIALTGNINSVNSTGNVTAPYFIGDGSQLTNLSSGSQISNGLSKVAITALNGNVTIDVGSSANVLQVSTGGITVAGNISLSGNVNAIRSTGNVTAPYFIGDGSLLTNVGGGGNYGNADVALFLQSYTGDITANNISLTNNADANIVYASAVSATSVNAPTLVGSLTGNVTGDLTGNTTGIHYGLIGSIDILELSWDFGTITGTITNPIQWLINNIGGGFDAGTILAANATNVDIGVLTN